jgi:AbrB family looped-hinge helix DNA binding protein
MAEWNCLHIVEIFAAHNKRDSLSKHPNITPTKKSITKQILTYLYLFCRFVTGRSKIMETSVVTSKGQIVIPVKIRRRLGIANGTKVAFVEQEGKIIIQPLDKNYFNNLSGILDEKGKMLKSLMEDKKKEREL